MRLGVRVRCGFAWLALGVAFVPGAWAQGGPEGPIDKADACGLVIDQTGRAIADATVTATAGDFKVTAASLSDGSFSLPETTSRTITLTAGARGYGSASETVAHLGAAGSRKCKHPVYVVLAAPGPVAAVSYMTTKKKNLPKAARR